MFYKFTVHLLINLLSQKYMKRKTKQRKRTFTTDEGILQFVVYQSENAERL